MAKFLITAPADLKPKCGLLLAGFTLPAVSIIINSAGLSPYGIDLAPYGFVAMNVLFELVSSAKNKVFDSMDDIVVIADRNNRIIDYNHTLYQIVPRRRKDYAGEHLSTLFKAYPEIAEFVTAHPDGEATIALGDGSGRVFKTRIHTIAHSSRTKGMGVFAKYLAMTNITKEMTMVRTMNDLANLDTLTGIANRRSFYNQIEQATGEERVGDLISVIMLGIDNFKGVNDTYGHKASDVVLRNVASLLSQNIRAQDVLSRFGGGEFIMAVPGMGANDAVALAQRLRKSIDASEIYDGQSIKVTASFGVASDTICPGFDIDLLIRHADAALYEAKGSGQDGVVLSNARSSPAI
ncbi:MAG TPA: hypothetical protein DDZ84_01675 [Firmicutes bacterium]|nr:hypothetical protein [Bacillota bacterium]